MRELLKAWLEVLDSGRRGALATVVRTSGSTPQQPGARMLLRPDGSRIGTVGGGAIEELVGRALETALRTGQSVLLAKDLARDLGMCCGGRMEILVEPIEATPRLWIIGAGHIARATAPLCRNLGFEVQVVDERETLNTAERFPGCRLDLRDPATLFAQTRFDERDWLLIVTHDHRLDQQALELALDKPARYIGLVGSRRKVLRLLERIRQRRAGATPALDRIYAPVGLDLGAIGPEEIAISIAAELVALRHEKVAPHLRAVGDSKHWRSFEELTGALDPEPLA